MSGLELLSHIKQNTTKPPATGNDDGTAPMAMREILIWPRNLNFEMIYNKPVISLLKKKFKRRIY
jgi:hypothetical protein